MPTGVNPRSPESQLFESEGLPVHETVAVPEMRRTVNLATPRK